MKIAHITSGCLSGSPIRIVDALNRHTPLSASLINTLSQDKRTFFDVGIDWGKQRDEAIELMRSADVIHAHDRKVIEELKEWIPQNAPVLLHHHGSPSREQYQGKVFPGEGHFYHTSIVQYPERYVPRARLLPNLIRFEEPVSAALLEDACARIFYSPTMPQPAWRTSEKRERWMTKGKREVWALISRVVHRYEKKHMPVAFNYLNQERFEICMRVKRASNIVVDDTVTGSYHLVGLEGLAMGIPVVGYIDRRIERMLKALTGAESIPWVNVHLEELEPTLGRLIQDGGLRKALGEASYSWMQRYYREEVLVEHFVEAYESLFKEGNIFASDRFDFSEKRDLWFVRDAYDAQHIARKRKKQRGAELTLSSPYVNGVSSAQPKNSIVSGLWLRELGVSHGAWFFTNRYKRVDGYSEVFFRGRREGLLNKYRMALPYAKNARVAVLGSGTGYGAYLLKEEGQARSVVAVEKDMLSVAYAEQEYPCQGVTYIQTDVLDSGLPAGSFDLIVAIDLLEWVDCDASLLEECRRLLAPGGVCVLSGGDFWDEGAEVYYLRRYTPQSFRNTIKGVFASSSIYRQPSLGKEGVGAYIQERYLTLLKEGESLLAICNQ